MFLNIVIVGLIAIFAWRVNVAWRENKAGEEALRNAKMKPPPAPPVAPLRPPQPLAATSYNEVVQKMLFAKDRNPTVIVEAPVVKPPKPMPPLPLAFGMMGLPSGPVVVMSDKPGARNRGVHVGESIGEFKLIAATRDDVTLGWEDKVITKRMDELRDHSGDAAAAQQAAGNSAPASAAQTSSTPPPPMKPSSPGINIGAEMKACQPGDTSPAGAVVDGMRKEYSETPFGKACRWVAVK